MKFQKFVKSLGSEGIVYVRKNEERWLASKSVFMKIPDDIRSVTARDMFPMPEAIENIINYETFTDPCKLYMAIMPCASGAIKDCIRVYATENALNTIAISNSDYALIEHQDCVEMHVKFNTENETSEAKALVIKKYASLFDEERDPTTIGIVLPIECEEGEQPNVH